MFPLNSPNKQDRTKSQKSMEDQAPVTQYLEFCNKDKLDSCKSVSKVPLPRSSSIAPSLSPQHQRVFNNVNYEAKYQPILLPNKNFKAIDLIRK